MGIERGKGERGRKDEGRAWEGQGRRRRREWAPMEKGKKERKEKGGEGRGRKVFASVKIKSWVRPWCFVEQAICVVADESIEQEVDRELAKVLLLMQKEIRGWNCRRKFQKMRSSCVVLQTYMRGYLCRIKYQQVSYLGLQWIVGLASHWPCVTDFSGLSTYGLTA